MKTLTSLAFGGFFCLVGLALAASFPAADTSIGQTLWMISGLITGLTGIVIVADGIIKKK